MSSSGAETSDVNRAEWSDNQSTTRESAETNDSQPIGQRSESKRLLTGMVRDQAGIAIVGATVSWTPTRLGTPGLPRVSASYAEWERASVLASTDSSGHFELEMGSALEPGVVWATAKGFEGASLWVVDGSERLAFALKSTSELTVQVLDDGAPTQAWVDVRGFVLRDLVTEDRDTVFPETLLMRRVQVAIEPTPFGGIEDCLLQAHVDSRVGALEGPFLDPNVVLDLNAPIQLTGEVFGLECRLPAQVHVFIEIEEGGEEWLATLPCLPSGKLCPQDVKRFTTGVYRFQLEGQLIPTQIERVDARTLGESHVLSLSVESGVPVRFQVVDDLGEAVEGASCRLVWFDGELGIYEVTGSVLQTDSTGHVSFTSVEYASAFLSCSKVGHAYVEAGPVVGPMETPLIVTLPRAGVIRGHVTFDGTDIERFSVVHYQGTGWGQYDPVVFRDREDGTFELDDVPVGDVELFALAPNYAQSAPITVRVDPGQVTEVELQLEVGGEGSGRVLNAQTREPIPGLEVLRPARSANEVIGMEVDNPISPQPDGRFVVTGLTGQNTRVGFRAEGYPASEAIASLGADGQYHFGLTLIAPLTELVGKVIAPTDLDPASVQVEVSGAFYAGPMPIPSSGRFEVSGAVPGYVNLEFTWTGGRYSATRFLRGQGPWSATIDLSGTHRMRLFADGLESFESEADSSSLGFRVIPILAANDRHKQAFSIPLGDATDQGQLTPGLAPGAYQVLLLRAGQIPLAQAEVQVGATDIADVHLLVKGEMRAVRILDAAGAPVSGMPVRVPNQVANGALVNTVTDESGLALLGMLPAGSLALHVGGYSTRQLDLVLDQVGTREFPTEVVFDPQANARLTVHDRGFPLEGVEVMVESAVTNQTIVWATASEAGTIEVTGVTPGPIRVLCLSPGVWPEVQTAILSEDEPEVLVEFRRLGALAVHVTDAAGHALTSLDVNLRSLEFDASLSDWIALGKLKLPGGMLTDSNGSLSISGIPNGDYEWSVADQTGTVHVPANGTATLGVKLLN